MPNEKKKKESPELEINPAVEQALQNTKEKLGFVGDKPPGTPDCYCWKHGNIGSATMLMIVGGQILSNHCLYCLSELLTATVGNVVPAEDFLKTQMLISSLAGQMEQQAKAPNEVKPDPKNKKTPKLPRKPKKD